ncbi:MAG: Hsp20/alpha crystallin family protein [Candidatus Xenobiia bacterium LiM19]
MAEKKSSSRKRKTTKSIISVGKRMFPFGSTGWGWDPRLGLESIRMTMNELCVELFYRSGVFFDDRPWEPPLDMFFHGGFLVVEIALPGISRGDVSIHATPTLLIIDGVLKREIEAGEDDFLAMERRVGRFSRAVPLPCRVIPEGMHSELNEGIVRLIFKVSKDMDATQVNES